MRIVVLPGGYSVVAAGPGPERGTCIEHFSLRQIEFRVFAFDIAAAEVVADV